MTVAPSNSASRAIGWGGLLAGVGDITQAFVAFGLAFHATPFRILQSIARGYFGPRTFAMGWTSALLGLATHFFIAFTAAAVYYLASRSFPRKAGRVLTEHAVVCGLLYGLVVFSVMYFVVMPLTPIGWPRMNLANWVTGPVGHPLLVGLPIALSVRKYSPRIDADARG
ncbi:MAG: hypothetical protein HYX28_10145 [Candidatus Koribacter versatilis]|uniref:DUF1440 domain-containing protein n=1 Tax=Candidatus Korobacter versatilis TaxID=658062 RepID=A0A932A9E0_9BACT|nr:hypothetical protein [Candidatus Koribacter versatilis]